MFGLAYAALFVVLDDAGALTGTLIGLVHGVVAGIAMAGMGSMHPRMDAPVSSGQQPVVTQDGGTCACSSRACSPRTTAR